MLDRMGPCPTEEVFTGRLCEDTQTLGYVKKEAETGMMHLQAEERQCLLVTPRNWKKQGRILS